MRETISTSSVIAGGGPAGMMLALLLAKQGIDVTLVESHGNFDRDFRGDTVHPATLEALDQIGLSREVMALARARISEVTLRTGSRKYTIANFKSLRTPFPFIAMVAQENFLDLIAEKLREMPNAHLIMSTRASDLIMDQGRVTGIRCEQIGQEPFEIKARCVIAADGRGSALRTKSGLEMVKTAPPMDVLWFRLSKKSSDEVEGGVGLIISQGDLVVIIDRGDYWQMGYVVLKGGFKSLKEKGLEDFKSHLLKLFPFFSDRLDELKEWNQTALLAVQTGYLKRWYLPGFLAIGDAAHIMSPVGGVGINYAVQDAICAANCLGPILAQGQEPGVETLATVQKRRYPSIRAILKFQELVQTKIISQALSQRDDFIPPLPLRLISKSIFAQSLSARFLAYGLRHERIENPGAFIREQMLR